MVPPTKFPATARADEDKVLRMTAPYFQLLGHLLAATHTCEHNKELASALVGQGLGQDQINSGAELAEFGASLPNRKVEETGDERIVEHGVHTSATEVEMWMQTVRSRLRNESVDAALIEKSCGEDLHSDEHVVEVAARALRMMGMLRTNETIHDAIGTGRSTRDLLIRGNTLMSKFFIAGDKLMSPGSKADPDAEVFQKIEDFERKATDWLRDLEEAVEGLTDRPELLGELAFLPEGVGLPTGGTGYSITLHERSEKRPPDPNEEVRPDPSWTIGRQGQNKENMGKGWVEPSFDE
jgi:hypothetical protein